MNTLDRVAALLVLLFLCGQASADTQVRDGNGTLRTIQGFTTPGTKEAPASVLVNSVTGAAYGPSGGLPTAPSVAPVTPVDRGGVIAAANTAQTVMAANAARKGGWITADVNNTGNEYVSLTGTASTTPGAGNQCVLTPGASCPLTINGYVIQTAVSLAGTIAGDAFSAVEFQ